MRPGRHPATGQQQHLGHYTSNADSCAIFNVLTGPQLLNQVEALLPARRARIFPRVLRLSMSVAQAFSVDWGCRQAVNDAMVKRVIGGMKSGIVDTGGY